MERSREDAVRIWHGLDLSLQKLHEALPGFQEAGREDLVECLEELINEAAAGRGEVEQEVLDDLEGGPGEVSGR